MFANLRRATSHDDASRIEPGFACVAEVDHIHSRPSQQPRADAGITSPSVGVQNLDCDRRAAIARYGMRLRRITTAPSDDDGSGHEREDLHDRPAVRAPDRPTR